MPFNIEAFKGEVAARNGVMKPSRFMLEIPSPPTYLVPTATGRSLSFWCEAANHPGYQLMMGDVRRWTYGPHEKRPFGPNIIPFQTLFLADADGRNIRFFHSWLNNIVAHYVGQNGTMESAAQEAGYLSPYEVRYKREYARDIHVHQYREDGAEVIHYVLREAFPSNVPDIPLSWDASHAHMRFPVVFDYLDWYIVSQRDESVETYKDPPADFKPVLK